MALSDFIPNLTSNVGSWFNAGGNNNGVAPGSYSPVEAAASPLNIGGSVWGNALASNGQQAGAAAVAGAGAGWQPSFLDQLVGYRDPTTRMQVNGWGNLALGAAQGIGGAFMGYQQYQLAKQSFDEQQRQFNLNFNTQRQTVNTALEDRQRARVASNPGAYQSVSEYMKQNGV